VPPVASCTNVGLSANDGIEVEGGGRTQPAAKAPGCSPLEASVVEEEIFGAVAAIDEDECPACMSRDVSAVLLACCVEPLGFEVFKSG